MHTVEMYLRRDIVGVDEPILTFKTETLFSVGSVYKLNDKTYFEVLDIVSTTRFEADSALIIKWVDGPESKAQ